MKRMKAVAPALVALMVLVCGVARGQVLKQVPADAMMVIKFKNLRATSDKLGALANKFGLAQMNPAASDPLGAFKNSINANNGLNEAGDAAMVVMPGKSANEKPDFVVLLPVSDYKAFLGNYPDATTEGEISSVKLPNKPDDQPGFAAQWGEYAALSDTRELLTKKPAGLTATGLSAKELDARDMVVFANMKAVRDQALPKLQQSRDKIKQQITRQLNAQNPQNAQKFQGLTNTVIDEVLGLAEQFLQQAQGATLGFDFTEDAIHPTGMVEFDPASNWGKTVAQVKSGNAPMFVGLPEAKYLFLMGMSVDPQSTTKLVEQVVAPIQGELAKLGDEGKAIQNYINAFKSYLASTSSQSSGLIAPTGALGQDSLVQVVSVLNGKSDQILDAQRDMFNTQQALMDATGTKAQVQTSYTANAKTVDGVQLNQFTTKFGGAGENPTPQEAQMQQMMSMMYGPNGMNGYTGAVTPDRAIVAAGVNDETLTKLIASAKAGETKVGQAESLTAVSNQLPKQRMFVMYIPLDNIATTGVSYAKQFGMPINVQLPENLQPIGISAGTEGSAFRWDAIIPAGTVQSLVSAGMQAYMNMMQGNQGGAGQGAP
ncbi:MAG TPA: hypothetical protein VF669_19620 [Tepidisphaeraceae bacterium]